MELRLLRDRNFALSTITMFLLGFVLYGSTMLLPLFLQTLLGYTAMRSGMVMSPGGIVVMVLMPIVGVLLARFQARWLVIFGMAVSAAGLFIMAGFNLEMDFRTAMLSRVIQGVGLAFLFVPINTVAFYFVPREKTSNATGLINLARNIGGSCGIAFDFDAAGAADPVPPERAGRAHHPLQRHVPQDDRGRHGHAGE